MNTSFNIIQAAMLKKAELYLGKDPFDFAAKNLDANLGKNTLKAEAPSGTVYFSDKAKATATTPGTAVITLKDTENGGKAPVMLEISGYGKTPKTKITYTQGDDSYSVDAPIRSLNLESLIRDISEKGYENIDIGESLYEDEYKGVTPGNMLLKARDMTPKQVAKLRNSLITLRASLIGHKAKELRGKGKNIQAFLLENKDKLLAGGTGLAAGSLGYMGAYAGLGLIPYMKQRKALRFLFSLLLGAGTGTAAGLLTHKFLTRHYTKSDEASAADLAGTLGKGLEEVSDIGKFQKM